jgi:tRNA-(ms[2]io[6]A)-hydroxylase
MRSIVRTYEPQRLVDVLIVGAFVEARSCERFAKLAPFLDDELEKFYSSLLKSEGRHYQDYLQLAQEYAGEPIDDRIAEFRAIEKELILSPDTEFRFHSGIPAQSAAQ